MNYSSMKQFETLNGDLSFKIANEAAAETYAIKKLSQIDAIVNEEGAPMQMGLITDDIIKKSNILEVTNPIAFERGGEKTIGGLFSDYIFGSTPKERAVRPAYISLHSTFIHPYVFEVMISLHSNVRKICAGESAWHVEKDGTLIEITDPHAKEYNEMNTGLSWFVKNFRKIKVFHDIDDNKTGSLIRSERLKLLSLLSDKTLFITKWYILPVFYRDATVSNGKRSIPEINDKYTRIIKFTKSISSNSLMLYNNKAMFAIQTTLCEIRKLGQSMIEKKNGFFRKSVLGKNIDYGARSVISTPSIEDCEKPSDCQVNIFRSGIPIPKCCELGYPFISKWVNDFFVNEFDLSGKKRVLVKGKGGKYEETDIDVGDVLSKYTPDFIQKAVNRYIHTPEVRFEPVLIPLTDGREAYIKFTGKRYKKGDSITASSISNRPFTWTDLLYMACADSLSDKMVYITRYPLTFQADVKPL